MWIQSDLLMFQLEASPTGKMPHSGMVTGSGPDYDVQQIPSAHSAMFTRPRQQGPERWQTYQSRSMRQIPPGIRFGLLFTGFSNLFGWFFFGFGMLFVWIFGASHYLHELAFFSGELQTSSGQITAVRKTRLEINDNRVYEYLYAFEAGGRSYRGSTDGYSSRYREGDSAIIEYSPGDPEHSRIAGMNLGLGGWPFLFTLIFPLVGAGFIIAGMRKGRKGIRLLKRGKEAVGRYLGREATSTRINNRTVYSYLFAFEDDNGMTHQVTGRSHIPERFAGEPGAVRGKRGAEGVLEPLVYNPDDPADAVLLDDLPGSPRVGGDGRVTMNGLGWSGVLLPAVVIIGNLLWILHVLEFL